MKKIISLFLSALMLLSLFAGCSIQPNPYKDDPEAAEEALHPQESQEPGTETETRDFAAAYAAYEPDMVVATVNGLDVTWSEYFYWCMNIMRNVEAYVGTIEDFNADFGGMSYADYFRTAAENNVRQYRAVEYYAQKEGIELSDEALAAIEDQLQQDIASVSADGTEEGLNEYLESIYTNRETYDYVNRVAMLYGESAVYFCGEGGEKLTEDEVLSFADQSGLMAAKHILLSTMAEDGTTHLSDDEKAEKLALAKELIERIDAGEDFDTLMAEYSEDPGSAAYPMGYCFATGEMVTEFEQAVTGLEVNEYTTEPVESSYGYHIVKKIPFTPDMVYTAQGMSIRQMAANEKFNSIINEWFLASPIEYADGFELDFAEVFGK
ncbi:MAG: peptidylprolyl isomerase [Candidatus Heteroscillospira sp.]